MTMPTLAINLASRGRPDLLRETIERTLPNIANDDTLFMVSIDEDDAETVASIKDWPSDKRLMPIVQEREDSLGAKYNRALIYAPADVYLTMVDYAPHVTPGFDRKILEAASVFPDGICVVYNQLANASFPQINAVTHKLAQKMGFIYPPWFPYWFVDHWLDDIAKQVNRISYADVYIDTDARPGTQGRREFHFWSTLFDAAFLYRRHCAHDIINSPDFDDPPGRKLASLAHYPLIEARSRWVNDTMRRDIPFDDETPEQIAADERYARVKAKGREFLKTLLPELEKAAA